MIKLKATKIDLIIISLMLLIIIFLLIFVIVIGYCFYTYNNIHDYQNLINTYIDKAFTTSINTSGADKIIEFQPSNLNNADIAPNNPFGINLTDNNQEQINEQ